MSSDLPPILLENLLVSCLTEGIDLRSPQLNPTRCRIDCGKRSGPWKERPEAKGRPRLPLPWLLASTEVMRGRLMDGCSQGSVAPRLITENHCSSGQDCERI